MSTAEVTRRIILSFTAAILLVAALLYVGKPPIVSDTLPARLTDKEFWRMITDFSEAGGYFRSDNFLSNEAGYQHVIPLLKKSIRPGGVYLGVRPEKNSPFPFATDPDLASRPQTRRRFRGES